MTRTEKIVALLALGWLVTRKSDKPAPASSATPRAPTPPAPGVQLDEGHAYQATIVLTGVEAMLGTANAVRDKLVGAGFRDVLVTDQGKGKFLARGVWGKPSTVAKLPAQVKNVQPAQLVHARIYQGPNDQYETVRMSVDLNDGKGFREMGIFSSRGKAETQAKQSGWIVDPATNT